MREERLRRLVCVWVTVGILAAAVVSVALVGAVSGQTTGRASSLSPAARATSTPTPTATRAAKIKPTPTPTPPPTQTPTPPPTPTPTSTPKQTPTAVPRGALWVGPNVNMVSGTTWPDGDPFLQRQNEPSIAVSTRNSLHLLAGANDYRTVDLPGLPEGKETGDAWLGVFRSVDGGGSWKSTLVPGYPQDQNGGSPLHGYEAGADPVVRAGTNGLFYYSGIVFDRSLLRSAAFVARFMDLNNETIEPVRYIDTTVVNSFKNTTAGPFIDKPWLETDIPRGGAQTVSLDVPQGNGTVTQTIRCGNVYMAWAEITGEGPDLRTQIMFSRSTDCGGTWSTPTPISVGGTVGQGATIAVAPATGRVYVAWRQFRLATVDCVQQKGYWKDASSVWPVASLEVGGVSYTRDEALVILQQAYPPSDAPGILAQQLIAAKLNVLSGADNEEIEPVITAADAWLVANPLHSMPSPADKQTGLALKDELEAFNTGNGGTPVCTAGATSYPDAILVVHSDDGGQTFTAPSQVATVSPFDQGTSEYSFRTNAYPTMAVDETGRAYLAWATRGLATYASSPSFDAGDARIVVTTSNEGTPWTTPRPIDQPKVPGHQLFPSLTYNGGKLLLVYNDFRGDVSGVFERYVVDLMDATHPLRHTVDVRAAVASPADAPVFSDYSILNPSSQVSRYPFIVTGTSVSDMSSLQLQYNPPNLPIFQQGTVPFFGDYLDVAGAPRFVPNGDGTWSYNTEPSTAPVYHAVWTDNRDVVGPPPGYSWNDYVPPGIGGTQSIFDSTKKVPACTDSTADLTQMRNQNIYTSLLVNGLFVGVPSNARPLSRKFQRAFVIFVQNATDKEKPFQLQILNPPNGVMASFQQFSSATTQTATIGAYSSISQTVFVKSNNPTASVDVQVQEVDQNGNPVAGGLKSTVRINPDPLNPPPADTSLSAGEVYTPAVLNPAVLNPAVLNPAVLNPAVLNPAVLNPAVLNWGVENPAVYNPAVLNPAVYNQSVLDAFNLMMTSMALLNPAVLNPAVLNPAVLNPAVLNPAVLNPAVLNPAVLNPAVYNPAVLNPAVLNPAVLNPAVYNTTLTDGSVTEANYVAQNAGNTTAAYSFNLNLADQQAGLSYQLMIYRLYFVPVANGCQLCEAAHQELLVNDLDPNLNASLYDPKGGDSFCLSPGDVAIATLRVIPVLKDPKHPKWGTGDPRQFPIRALSASVVAKAVNSDDAANGDTQPPFVTVPASNLIPLVITSTVPPSGVVGSPYSASATASGGTGSYGWSAIGVPPGLTASAVGSNWFLTGTPTTAGTFTCTIRVTDGVQLAQQTVTVDVLTVAAPVTLAFTVQPTDAVGGQPMASIAVQALDSTASPVPGVNISIDLGVMACSAATLTGLKTVTTDGAGIASFPNLAIDKGGWGYTLTGLVTANHAINVTSNAFNVEGFCDTGGLSSPRGLATATRLENGMVLIAGGADSSSSTPTTAELFDPTQNSGIGSFVPTGSLIAGRFRHTATLLKDGRVLLTGGQTATLSVLASAELYDPVTATFVLTGAMNTGRALAQANRLLDGRVLITGGVDSSDVVQASAELFDPSGNGGLGSFTSTGSMTTPRTEHTATELFDGRILVSGGRTTAGAPVASAEIYDPATGAFSPTGTMTTSRHGHTATLLLDGRVLITGGGNSTTPAVASAELFDPVAGTFSLTGAMSVTRLGHTATLLPDGSVLIAGGVDINNNFLASAEMFNPTTGTFSQAGSMAAARDLYEAALLPNGKVLMAGGVGTGHTFLSGAELFFPTGGYALSGRILWNNTDLITSKTSVIPFFWARDEFSGKQTQIVSSFDPPTSAYSVSGIFADRIYLGVYFVSPTSFFGGSPGDYWVDEYPPPLSTLSQQQRSNYTLNAYVLMRLREPLDNSADCDINAVPTYLSPVTFAWDPVTDASEYQVMVWKYANGDWTDPKSEVTQSTSTTMTLGPSAPGEVYRFWVSAQSSTGIHVGSALCSGSSGYGDFSFVIAEPLVITTTALPGGTVGSPYSQTLAAAGGAGTRTWSLAAGALPPGIGLSADGVLSGTPTTSGSFAFTVQVTDGSQTASQALSITVAPAGFQVASLAFRVQPADATGGQTMASVAVQALDAAASPVPDVDVTIDLGTKGCSAAGLTGSTTVTTDEAGVATFPDLAIDKGGWGYTLNASATGNPAINVTSNTFNIEGFCDTGSLATARDDAPALLLPNGKVLVAGGAIDAVTAAPTATAELFDPAGNSGLGSFASTGSMTTARTYFQAVALSDGRVLVSGGHDAERTVLASAEIYDPTSGTFAPTGSMGTARQGRAASLLPDGRVLICGGGDGTVDLSSAELFDPAGNGGVGSFAPTGSMGTPRQAHTATSLLDGRVLVAGGATSLSAEVYDPTTGAFTPTGGMTPARFLHAATLLADGKVLITGGYNDSDGFLASAEIYEPGAGTFTATASMGTARAEHTSTLLPDGRVLISGGYNETDILSSAEIYDPATGLFTPAGNMGTARYRYTATSLPNGKVLTSGGIGVSGTCLSSAELFFPFPPSVFMVTNTNDSGSGSLRQAILDANAHPGLDAIHFAIPSSGVQAISPASALPIITDPVLVDATTQPGYGGTPLIRLDGASVGSSANGLEVQAGNSLVRSFMITRFSGAGIVLHGSATHVESNFIGTDGTNALGNVLNGIIVDGGSGNVIAANVVSGTSHTGGGHIGNGIDLSGGAVLTIIIGNRIGTNAAGTAAIGNQGWGIFCAGAYSTIIGGTTAAKRNLISGNAAGIGLASTHDNIVKGNWIGLDISGNAAIPNWGAGGVALQGTSDDLIGGQEPGAGNVISGNASSALNLFLGTSGIRIVGNLIGTDAGGTAAIGNYKGVVITSGYGDAIVSNVISGNNYGVILAGGVHDTVVAGNRIGTDATGEHPLGNAVQGVRLEPDSLTTPTVYPDSNLIGGVTSADANVISGNGAQGIFVLGGTNNTIQGNRIGTNSSGTAGMPNGLEGIYMKSVPSASTISGNLVSSNIISGNGSNGITLDTGATGAVIAGNTIGTNAAGTAPLGNNGDGIGIYNGASGNTVSDNTVAASTYNGIRVYNTANGNTIRHNWIGTNPLLTTGLGNANQGISVEASTGTTIGGSNAGEGNVVANNAQGGILLESSANNTQILGNVVSGNTGPGIGVQDSQTATIAGNRIGTDIAGSVAWPNSGDGIWLTGETTSWITIGGKSPGAANVISGNAGNGLTISGLTTAPVSYVWGNLIGTDATGTAPLPNAGAGVSIDASNNDIGDNDVTAGNLIAYNTGAGVYVGSGTGNQILSNRIFANASWGIAMGEGANGDMVAPVIASATDDGTLLTVTGTVALADPLEQLWLDFFANTSCDPSGYGQGAVLLGHKILYPYDYDPGAGVFRFTAVVSGGNAGKVITATATTMMESWGNSSQFSACLVASGPITGSITEFPIPTVGSEPIGIAAGPDGNLWFTEFVGNNIGQISPAGVITESPVPTAGSEPVGIVAGPDGALWFTEGSGSGNKIGRITTAGAITEFVIPTAGSYPTSIAAGPDGALWFTEELGNKIGRLK
jgi:parallel beta-helix repeat protein